MTNAPTSPGGGAAAGRRVHRPRVMPVLLLKGDLLYKTVKFKEPKYVGDPRIAVKIFNDKGADEIVLLDIDATPQRKKPNFALIEEIASEAFMPMAYGGGVRSTEDVRTLLTLGVEKVIVNTAAEESPDLITEASRAAGSQSVVGGMDVKRDMFGRYRVLTQCGKRKTGHDPVAYAKRLEQAGAGEILLNSIDRDGTFAGFDLPLVRKVADAVEVPVVACGGAGKLEDVRAVVREGQASAAAAGSIFVFQGPHRAVLIKFPGDDELRALFG